MQLQVLEVAMGLFAAFFLVSLIASALVEVLSQLLKKRSNDLDAVLTEMLAVQSTNGFDFKDTSVYKAMQAASGQTRRPGSDPSSRNRRTSRHGLSLMGSLKRS